MCGKVTLGPRADGEPCVRVEVSLPVVKLQVHGGALCFGEWAGGTEALRPGRPVLTPPLVLQVKALRRSLRGTSSMTTSGTR